MIAKIKMHQYISFIRPRKFATADIESFTISSFVFVFFVFSVRHEMIHTKLKVRQ